jgi:hypothetical protein
MISSLATRLPRRAAARTAAPVTAFALASSSASARPTPSMASNRVALFRATPPALLPWPIIIRVVGSIVTVIGKTLWDAHRAEATKMATEAIKNAATPPPQMAVAEALQVLHVAVKGDPMLVEVPLTGPMREEAVLHFHKYMKAACETGPAPSEYLQGKFSAAYRVLVDERWDDERGDEDAQAEHDKNIGK